ncbi:MAG: tRNA 2'-phosphotransferase, partial [Sedimenticola sp.]
EQVNVPCAMVHGTTASAWATIRCDGLRPMGRRHIHFASGAGAKSGYRRSSEVLIDMDTPKILADGLVVHRSLNGVLLTEGINGLMCPCYFRTVTDSNGCHLREWQCVHHSK